MRSILTATAMLAMASAALAQYQFERRDLSAFEQYADLLVREADAYADEDSLYSYLTVRDAEAEVDEDLFFSSLYARMLGIPEDQKAQVALGMVGNYLAEKSRDLKAAHDAAKQSHQEQTKKLVDPATPPYGKIMAYNRMNYKEQEMAAARAEGRVVKDMRLGVGRPK